LCTKNYENPSIFVKVTAKKSVAPFFPGHGVYLKERSVTFNVEMAGGRKRVTTDEERVLRAD